MRGKHLPFKEFYFLMNKSDGTVCSHVSDSHHTVYESFPSEILIDRNGAKLHTIGRLDSDTEGLLLLTNNGNLSNFLTRPENKIERVYLVHLKNSVLNDERKIYSQKAKDGILLPPEKKFGEQKSDSALLEWISEKKCKITLTDGKFHEVKRIFRALGNEVEKLKRIKFAGISLPEDLRSGEWRELTEDELKILKNIHKNVVAKRQ